MIVALGDSITYGQHLDDPKKAWPRLVRGRVVVPMAVPGDTTRIGLERFPKSVQEMAPDAVVIQYGHNDCNRWETDRGLTRVSIDAFAANLEEMIERCRKFEATPLLCTLTPSYRNDQHAADVEDYDWRIRGIADFHQVHLADVRGAFTKREYVMEDGLHLTELGHRVYAEVVQQVLDAEQIP
jgi:lysophospholipase L1-like esterase